MQANTPVLEGLRAKPRGHAGSALTENTAALAPALAGYATLGDADSVALTGSDYRGLRPDAAARDQRARRKPGTPWLGRGRATRDGDWLANRDEWEHVSCTGDALADKSPPTQARPLEAAAITGRLYNLADGVEDYDKNGAGHHRGATGGRVRDEPQPGPRSGRALYLLQRTLEYDCLDLSASGGMPDNTGVIAAWATNWDLVDGALANPL